MFLNANKSILRKMLTSSIVTVLLGLCAVGLVISIFAKDYIVDSKSNEMIRQAKQVNLAIQNQTGPSDRFKEQLRFFDEAFDSRIWIFDLNGNIVTTSSKDEVNVGKVISTEVVNQVLNGEPTIWNQSEGFKEGMLSIAVPWGKDNDVYGGIVLHSPLKGMNETITQLRETILWVTLLGIFFHLVYPSICPGPLADLSNRSTRRQPRLPSVITVREFKSIPRMRLVSLRQPLITWWSSLHALIWKRDS